MKTIMFTEHNEWEGEDWNFFLDVTPEIEQMLLDLSETIAFQNCDCYEIDFNHFSQEFIQKKLAEESEMMYMEEWNYPGELLSVPTAEELYENDPFYKGGIEKFCVKNKEKK